MLSNERIINNLKGKIHCSQIVLSEACKDAGGFDSEELLRIASPFGGGMFCGDTCGAVIGALMAIGIKYGNCEHGNKEQDAICVKKTKEFQKKFTEQHGSTICRELLGCDFSDPEQRREALETGKIFEVCPKFIAGALQILSELSDIDEQ